MGFFYTCPNPTVSTVQEKRMQEIKNCHSQDSKHQRDATAWGMKQYLSSSRCAFSAAFNQHLQHLFRTGAPARGDAVLSSSSPPCTPGLAPTALCHRGFPCQECERSQAQQGLCPQFFTFSLSRLSSSSSAFAVCARGSGCSRVHKDEKCSPATSKQNKSIFLPEWTLTALSKWERNF